MPNHIFIVNKIKSFKKKITVSSDKSISIRSILLASQAVGTSKISNLLESEDVKNTLKTVKKLGVSYKKTRNIREYKRTFRYCCKRSRKIFKIKWQYSKQKS